jgi:pimeloyl-ACP methyl ester carboxylesterase
MPGAERIIALDDGATTTLESWGDRGPAVLCVHGITSSRKSWERTANALSGSYRVFAFDQRGHGDSAEIPGPMTLQRSVDDLRSVAHTIGEPLALIGHSWGGAVVLLGGRESFANKVEAIDPMIRVAGGTWGDDYLNDTESVLALGPADMEATVRRNVSAWDEVDIAGKLHAMQRMRAETIARLGSDNEVDAGKWDLREVVVAYPKPLLILAAGPSDSVMSAQDLDFVRRWSGPHVLVKIFDDQGHNLHRTAFDRYMAATKEFLALRS